ncbi:MAG: hypothetical protein WCP45_13575 [Verrucomicrobiota bacterium]
MKSTCRYLTSTPCGVLEHRVSGWGSGLRQVRLAAFAALAIQLAGTPACTAGDTGESNGSSVNTSAADVIPQRKPSGSALSSDNDITWMRVPEPAAALLGGIGLLLILRRRRSA